MVDDDILLRRYWGDLSQEEQAAHIRSLMAQEWQKQEAERQRQLDAAQREWQANQKRQQPPQPPQSQQRPGTSINEAVQRHYGLDKLGKNWDKKRLADAHYAIDL